MVDSGKEISLKDIDFKILQKKSLISAHFQGFEKNYRKSEIFLSNFANLEINLPSEALGVFS